MAKKNEGRLVAMARGIRMLVHGKEFARAEKKRKERQAKKAKEKARKAKKKEKRTVRTKAIESSLKTAGITDKEIARLRK